MHGKGCMTSKWASLTDDLTGSIACGLRPDLCLAACAIACSGLLPSGYCSGPSGGTFSGMTVEQIFQALQNNGYIVTEYATENSYIVM